MSISTLIQIIHSSSAVVRVGPSTEFFSAIKNVPEAPSCSSHIEYSKNNDCSNERTRTGEVAKGGSATFQRPTAQDALVDMEVVGCSIFAHRLIDTVLSRYPVAI
jgi:hypothetical protein